MTKGGTWNAPGTRTAGELPRLAAGRDSGAAGGVPLPGRAPRGNRRREARLSRRRRRRGRARDPRDAAAERRRRTAPFRLEPLLVGVSRPRSVAPDRAGLPLVADPRRQRRRRPEEA